MPTSFFLYLRWVGHDSISRIWCPVSPRVQGRSENVNPARRTNVRDGTPTPELLVLHYSRTLAAVDRTVFYDQSDSLSFKHVLDHVIIM